MPATDARRARIELAWAAAWDDGNVDALDDLLSADYVRHGHDDTEQGLSDFKAAITNTRSAFPDLVTRIDGIVIEGDNVAIRWHSEGVHNNAFLGVPATKQAVKVRGATFGRFEGDKIVEEYVTWDPRALLTALGIITVGRD